MDHQLIDRIVKAIIDVPGKIPPRQGDHVWTTTVKSALVEVGLSADFKVCTSGFQDIADREWLYDLVWYDNNSDGLLKSVRLVAESEWATTLKGVKYDFEKLLVANSELKVMVCQTGQESFETLLEYFSRAIAAYGKAGAECVYLIFVFLNSKHRFECCLLDQSGKPFAGKAE